MNIFVAKLSFTTTNEDLEEAFGAYGTVDKASVIMDRETGRSKGFGFVEMSDDKAAKTAITKLDGTQLKGNAIVVKEATPRGDDRRSGGGGFQKGGFNRDRGDFNRNKEDGGGGYNRNRDDSGGYNRNREDGSGYNRSRDDNKDDRSSGLNRDKGNYNANRDKGSYNPNRWNRE